ncbi:MAG TPA: hypothetical protein VE755_03980 [Myxococcales bacterium]|nr:hypothetical protein [Myxococcales bacterium]
MTTRNFLMAATAAALLFIASRASAEPVLVAHPSCPVSRLSADDARKLLVGEDLIWRNGDATQLVELRADDAAVTAGYLAIAHKTASQIRAEWNRLVFAGRANPPLRFGTVDEVRAAVARTPGTFAVIDSASADATVKIIFRTSGKG